MAIFALLKEPIRSSRSQRLDTGASAAQWRTTTVGLPSAFSHAPITRHSLSERTRNAGSLKVLNTAESDRGPLQELHADLFPYPSDHVLRPGLASFPRQLIRDRLLAVAVKLPAQDETLHVVVRHLVEQLQELERLGPRLFRG